VITLLLHLISLFTMESRISRLLLLACLSKSKKAHCDAFVHASHMSNTPMNTFGTIFLIFLKLFRTDVATTINKNVSWWMKERKKTTKKMKIETNRKGVFFFVWREYVKKKERYGRKAC